jgi:hypothetical protein
MLLLREVLGFKLRLSLQFLSFRQQKSHVLERLELCTLNSTPGLRGGDILLEITTCWYLCSRKFALGTI